MKYLIAPIILPSVTKYLAGTSPGGTALESGTNIPMPPTCIASIEVRAQPRRTGPLLCQPNPIFESQIFIFI